jgi:DNA invertase Pin-like site-specific DNA recombinase
MSAEKVGAQHRARKAVLYVRQSSAHQVQHNRESQALQYAMRDRLARLGWSEIEIIDEDLGCSAAGGITRPGFERMVAEVCLGKVGAVAAREVSRFARNSHDWQQLVEMCRVVDTLLIDQEAVYAPRQGNDRLLLGLKGSLNEYELDLLRQRSLAARHEKARRGELVVSAPVGFVKVGDRLEKDPDRRVQAAIQLAIDKVGELGSVRQALLWFLEHKLDLPTRINGGALAWRCPRYSTIRELIANPAYGGAYAYGKTGVSVRYGGAGATARPRRKPRVEWLALKPDAHEGYVDWDRAEAIRKMVSENVPTAGSRGAPKHGAALLSGLLRCRRCGRKLTVQYTGARGQIPRYACVRGRLDYGEPSCIAFGGLRVDDTIEAALPAFLEEKLAGYATGRNEPAAGQSSHLSPYLHFGQISPVKMALAAIADRPGGDPDRAAFLEELIVRRELSHNFVTYNASYDSFDGLSRWAAATLDKHRQDPRPQVYGLEELEAGATHDPYFNAAMREMRLTGFMQNYMRMYWGKKILEYSRSPEEAYATTLALNNKHFLCGRDPNASPT